MCEAATLNFKRKVIAKQKERQKMTLTEEKINAISNNLKNIPKKNKFNKREALEKLSGDIQELKKKGYSLKEIKILLEKEGLKISVATLRTCTPTTKKRQIKETKTRQSKNQNEETEVKKEIKPEIQKTGFVEPDPDEI